MVLPEDRAYALEWARRYRKWGWNPIPSSTTNKQPLFSFAAEYGWETLFPDGWFSDDGFPDTCNLQLTCGRRWGLFVVDLDGAEAKTVWDRWVRANKCPRTWVVHREDGDSFHWWFRPPDWWTEPIRKRFAWRHPDPEVKHSGIEILGERSLIVAPPSRHVKTGGQYRFLAGHSYRDMVRPAVAPAWIMNLKPIEREIHAPAFVPPMPKYRSRAVTPETFLDRDELLGRLPDKIGIAREWGIRFTGKVSPTGWHECHALDRPDQKPSAAVHQESGIYTDRGSGGAISFYDLMRATGHAHDFDDARARLMERIR